MGFNSKDDRHPKATQLIATCYLSNPFALLYERVSLTEVIIPWNPVRPHFRDHLKKWLNGQLQGVDWREIYGALEIAMLGKGIQLRKAETSTLIKCLSKHI